MKACSVIGLVFAAAMLASIPIAPQVTPRGVELGTDRAHAVTYRHYRRVHRRMYRRSYRYVRRVYRHASYGFGLYYRDCVGYFGPGCCGAPGPCRRGLR